MKSTTKNMAVLGMLTALAFAAVSIVRIPMVAISPETALSYEPKDVIIHIGGFILGPLASLIITVASAFIEMVTISSTSYIGFLMNVLSSASFTCTAAYIYMKNRTLKGAVLGLVTGSVAVTAVMLLWNYLITPMYTGAPREVVAGMLLPVFLPFNLIKSGINSAIVMLVYKPAVMGFRAAGLLSRENGGNGKFSIMTVVVSAGVIISGILLTLVIFGVM